MHGPMNIKDRRPFPRR